MPRPRRYGSAERPLAPTAPARRPPSSFRLSGSIPGGRSHAANAVERHPLTDGAANARLEAYDSQVKGCFDRIVPVLKRLSALQHDDDFVEQAQRHARRELGHELPPPILESAWVTQLDMRSLFAWCLFKAYEEVSSSFFRDDPLQGRDGSESSEAFNAFLLSCGFHLLDVSPCADGRLAHAIAYALRIPFGSVRRRPHAGAMFDVENTVDRWVRTEHLRFREARPNGAHEPTRYLKVVVYHFSSRDPRHEGCAAHGSNDAAAAAAGLQRLQEFRQAVENSFCCGASVDLLLIGLDTDTDAIRVHVPDVSGHTDLEHWLDALDLHAATLGLSPEAARDRLLALVLAARSDSGEQGSGVAVDPGMARLIARLIEHNISQIDFVRAYHHGAYADAGHAERFIGVGIGFKEIHLRNLTYFAHMDTVEEGAADLDVGVKIFTGLNVSRGLPIPVVIRFDYHGSVPGARDRAVLYCRRTDEAIQNRYPELVASGQLHTLLSVRDRDQHSPAETVGSSIRLETGGGH
ncbi:carboxysome shell carbonic anhydrase [Synechococcus sp. BSF8S]|uniref:carboxysome shell carbonic anhydrase n=1 Tax=Synechococcales TaxID=1890424 RepID=UPI0016250C79|nr:MULTISPECIES: carboxysome shell carbonic anhydrase [unclassified Synechococcus]MBC1260955.1 carboxysome shell carbonic anhydrase [Synechococcus sp. BSF8S]MBC1263632.1 carboxysome shell carbonic anhydrase [Synechococcus sp. BSA11S]